MKLIIKYYLFFINLISYSFYYIDKKRAIKNRYRIPEKVLILFCVIGGSLGCTLGMNIFHHKTKHLKFIIINYLFLALLVLFIIEQSILI